MSFRLAIAPELCPDFENGSSDWKASGKLDRFYAARRALRVSLGTDIAAGLKTPSAAIDAALA